jgi:hypothetical protein
MAFNKTVFQLFTQHLGNADPAAYIGTAGEIFYDPNFGILKLSDGQTPGGISITTGGASGAFDPTLYYTRAAVDGKFTALLGTADAQNDTLGELQTKVDEKLAIAGGTLSGPVYYAPMPVGVSELTNKAYVDSKVATAVAATSSTLNTTNVTEGVNLYWTQTRFDTSFAGKSTTNLTEGTNYYWTQARFDLALALKTTTDVVEGTNLYWTQARFDSNFATSIANPAKTSGIVRTVNGIVPNLLGNVAISLQSTITGSITSKPTSADDGTLYVVVGDPTPTNDGKSFVWANTTQQWIELSPADMATNDARYINASGDTMNGPLTLVGAPVAPLHAATKDYVDSISYSLDGLTDVSTAGATAGQALVFNGTQWSPVTPASYLDNLLDVTTTGVTAGQALVYDGTNWVPATPASRLSNLLDVTITGATAGQALIFNGTNWVSATNPAGVSKIGELTDVSNTVPTEGQVLAWDATGVEWKPITPTPGVIDTLLDVDTTTVAHENLCWKLASTGSIRHGQMLTVPEMESLFQQLMQCNQPYYWRNQKPIIIQFDAQQLNEYFN